MTTRPATTGRVRIPVLWLRLSFAAAVVSAAASVAGLVAGDRIYGQETTVLADAAAAQDIVGLILVAPLIIALGGLTARGSVPAYLCWLGCLAFTAYNYAIYAFSIHFGPLFLPWTAVLGLSVYALAGGLAAADAGAVKAWLGAGPVRGTAWVLIGFGVLFVLLWLSEIVPDLLAGRPSASAADWRVPSNPVHVLDLALFLPAVIAAGLLLRRQHPAGYLTAAPLLVFLALTCGPILVTPAVQAARGHQVAAAVLAPIGLVLVITLVTLLRMLRTQPAPEA